MISLRVFCNDVNAVRAQWLHSTLNTKHRNKMPPVLFSSNLVTKPPFYDRKWTWMIIYFGHIHHTMYKELKALSVLAASPPGWLCNFLSVYQLLDAVMRRRGEEVFNWRLNYGSVSRAEVSLLNVISSHCFWPAQLNISLPTPVQTPPDRCRQIQCQSRRAGGGISGEIDRKCLSGTVHRTLQFVVIVSYFCGWLEFFWNYGLLVFP